MNRYIHSEKKNTKYTKSKDSDALTKQYDHDMITESGCNANPNSPEDCNIFYHGEHINGGTTDEIHSFLSKIKNKYSNTCPLYKGKFSATCNPTSISQETSSTTAQKTSVALCFKRDFVFCICAAVTPHF